MRGGVGRTLEESMVMTGGNVPNDQGNLGGYIAGGVDMADQE